MEKTDKCINPFHDRLKEVLGTNFEAISDLLGVSVSTVRDRWYKGSYPGADKISIIIEKTGCSPAWLLTGEKATPTASKFSRDIDLLRKIHDHGNKSIINSIHSSLETFAYTVDMEQNKEKDIMKAKIEAEEKAEKKVAAIQRKYQGEIKDRPSAIEPDPAKTANGGV